MRQLSILWACGAVALLPLAMRCLAPTQAQILTSAASKPPAAASKPLLDLTAPDVEQRLTPTSTQVTVTRNPNPAPGVAVTIAPGQEGYPGVKLSFQDAPLDLSGYGHVEARLVNTSAKPISVALRVDNAGNWQDNPWNTEGIDLQPGAAGTVTTIFGYSYGHKPGYALKPVAVVNILLFTLKADVAQSFRLESLVAAGPAGEKPFVGPDDVRVQPNGGMLLDAGINSAAVPQLSAKNAQATLVGSVNHQSLHITFPVAQEEQSISVKPASGRWDLRDDLEVRVKLKNDGPAPLMPRLRLESNGGPSEWVTPAAPLAPGGEQEVVIPFANAKPANLARKGTENHVTSDAVGAITIATERADTARSLLVESITAALPPAPPLPTWLGQRPPLEGDWVKTLDDEFDGNTLDTTTWRVQGENYYDKQTHWSKDDVLIGDGVARLRYEKKTGFHNDDSKRKETPYAAGYLDTFDKWAQRYGYFEARMKLPRSPGLWPAFWMMPDRGRGTDPQGKRQTTSDGGMEFDIMEHLTRWGPNRYNIAMHYDGYAKDHKQLGSERIYIQPDKDGFITCGLLWTPGSAIYYCNGREVLRWEDPRISDVPAMLMFTLPMGGWDNNGLDDAKLPADFIIDYVRVWQRQDLVSESDGKKPPVP